MTNNTKRIASLLAAGVVLTSAGATVAHAESPAPTNETVTEEQTSEFKYVVKEGDTLGKIAEKYLGCSDFYPAIAKRNGLCDPNKLSVGQVLFIPNTLDEMFVFEPVTPVQPQEQPCQEPATIIPENLPTYTVKGGDTMLCIVRTQYGLTGAAGAKAVDQLATFNGMYDPNLISVGQVIYLPDLETLLSIVPNDYTDRYNELGERLAAQERAKHCPGWVNPCWEYVGPCGNIIYVYPTYPVCPDPYLPEPCHPEPKCGCHGPRLTLHP